MDVLLDYLIVNQNRCLFMDKSDNENSGDRTKRDIDDIGYQ